MRTLLLLVLVASAAAERRHVRPFPPAAASLAPSLAPGDAEAVWGVDRSPVRPEQAEILTQLIADTQDAEEKADYLFRLATIHVKTSLNERGTMKGKDALLKAVKTFKALVDDDRLRSYVKMDAALFQYGYVLQRAKYLKEARAVYDRLLKNHPESIYVPIAHLAFADYYFEAGQLADAEARYKMVLKFPKSAAYAYALYKLGWVQVQQQRVHDAVETLTKVVAATRDEAKQAALAAAARKDLAVLQTPAGGPDGAWSAGRYADAGRAYAAIAADLDTPNDKAREAARNAAAAFMNALDLDPDPSVQLGKLEMRSRATRAKPLSATETAMLEVFTLYEALVRDSRDPHLGAMRLVEAGVLRAHGDHARAVPVLIDYLHWNAQLAELAARAVLDSLVAQNKQGEALDLAARWQKDDFLTGKADLARDVELLRSRSIRR